jgi:alkylation response protein AidB-like acyl-CoA dehydrogenase
MGATGWGTPTWPQAYGGVGLTFRQASVLRQEMARIGAFNPLLADMGVTMIGPTILDHGTDEQKPTHLPRIARGEVRWCFGHSEPNAIGSRPAADALRGPERGASSNHRPSCSWPRPVSGASCRAGWEHEGMTN